MCRNNIKHLFLDFLCPNANLGLTCLVQRSGNFLWVSLPFPMFPFPHPTSTTLLKSFSSLLIAKKNIFCSLLDSKEIRTAFFCSIVLCVSLEQVEVIAIQLCFHWGVPPIFLCVFMLLSSLKQPCYFFEHSILYLTHSLLNDIVLWRNVFK